MRGIFLSALTAASLALAAPCAVVDGESRAAEGRASGLSDQLQFYSPKTASGVSPLILFLDGGPDEADSYDGDQIARALAGEGVGVALIEAKGAAVDKDTAARDIAGALAFLAEESARFGHDKQRIFCLGRGWGAEVIASIVLDPTFLSEAGESPSLIAGAMTLNGDLTALVPPVAQEASALSAARNSSHLPRLLFLTQSGGPRESAISARRLAKGLRASGAPFANDIIVPRDPNATPWGSRDLTFHLILDFVGALPLPQPLSDRLRAEYAAKSPPLSNDDIWAGAAKVEKHPIDREFMEALGVMFAGRPELLSAFPLDHYHAVDLLDYLATLPAAEVGSGDYLVTTNIRGQRLNLTREQLERVRPQLVIGIDDERNLFRLSIAYRTRMDYSWLGEDGEPRPWLLRRLGAFLHAPGQSAPDLFPRTTTRFALVSRSFRWRPDDPLAALSDLSPRLRDALESAACVECHSFRGVEVLGHHIGAFTGEPEAGLALALEDYPAETMERFLSNQKDVARRMGTNPVAINEELASLLHELIFGDAETAHPQP